MYISVACELLLDLCDFENFIWIDWLKNVHTKR